MGKNVTGRSVTDKVVILGAHRNSVTDKVVILGAHRNIYQTINFSTDCIKHNKLTKGKFT